MKEPEIVRQWKLEGRAEGWYEGKADSLLLVLYQRFGPVPDPLAAQIVVSRDRDQLNRWTILAVTASTLEQFQQEGGFRPLPDSYAVLVGSQDVFGWPVVWDRITRR